MKRCPLLCAALALASCAGGASDAPPPVTFARTICAPGRYPMSAESEGVKAAAVAFAPNRDVYADPSEVRAGESLNVLEAGVLPIRLIVWNETQDEILLDPEQILGVAGAVSHRPVPAQEAVEIVLGSKVFKEAVKTNPVGPVLKGLLGGDILVEALRGGVRGASGGTQGAGSGAAKAAAGVAMERANAHERSLTRMIADGYASQALKRQTLYPGFIADGLVFLPSQAGITSIRIPLYALNGKKGIALRMELK